MDENRKQVPKIQTPNGECSIATCFSLTNEQKCHELRTWGNGVCWPLESRNWEEGRGSEVLPAAALYRVKAAAMALLSWVAAALWLRSLRANPSALFSPLCLPKYVTGFRTAPAVAKTPCGYVEHHSAPSPPPNIVLGAILPCLAVIAGKRHNRVNAMARVPRFWGQLWHCLNS